MTKRNLLTPLKYLKRFVISSKLQPITSTSQNKVCPFAFLLKEMSLGCYYDTICYMFQKKIIVYHFVNVKHL